jgi:hypothetical protein
MHVKSTEDGIGNPVVSALCGKVAATEHGLLVTLGTFRSHVQTFGKSKSSSPSSTAARDGLMELVSRDTTRSTKVSCCSVGSTAPRSRAPQTSGRAALRIVLHGLAAVDDLLRRLPAKFKPFQTRLSSNVASRVVMKS